MNLSLEVLRGAIVGAFAIVAGGFILLAIIGVILYGPFGWLMGFYFGGWLILYGGPIGMIIGAIIAIIRIVAEPSKDKANERESRARCTKTAHILLIVLPLILVVGLAAIPFVMTNVDRNVTHGANWYFVTDLNDDWFKVYAERCDVEAVLLVLTDYDGYDFVCSSAVNNYLRSEADAVVPIIYRVTYDFDNPRSFQLIRVGDVQITWREWLASAAGCGREPLLACDSPQAQRGSPLYESSWPNDSQQENR